MTTLPDFLLARIAEDEAVARAAVIDDQGQTGGMEDSFDLLTGREQWYGADVLPRYADEIARLIVRTAIPARVLADCEAKRRIVLDFIGHEVDAIACGEPTGLLGYVAERALGHLALPYADHPDFDKAWRV